MEWVDRTWIGACLLRTLPVLASLGLIVLERLPIPLPGLAAVSPNLALISLYYWAVYRSDLQPAPVVFLLGLAHDLLSGGPLGVGSFVFLSCCGGVLWRDTLFQGRSFSTLWAGFVVIVAATTALQWGLTGLILQSFPAPATALFSWLLSIAFFPLVALPLLALHRTLPGGVSRPRRSR